jgi:hypothetical protein
MELCLLVNGVIELSGTRRFMKVKELRDKLSSFDNNAEIHVYWENGKPHQFFVIDEVSMTKGTPSRDANGAARFTFGGGPANWLFMSISAESE